MIETKLEQTLNKLSPTALQLLDLLDSQTDPDGKVTDLPRAILEADALEEHLFELEDAGLLTPRIEYYLSPMYSFYRRNVLLNWEEDE